MLIKFCGMTNAKDLGLAASLGAGFCGFIFHPQSQRYINPEAARALPSGGMARVGVFVRQQASEIVAAMGLAKLNYAQLHGNQDVECAMRIGPERVIRVLWPALYQSCAQLMEIAEQYASSCAFFLLDAGTSSGGSGKKLPWATLGELKLPKPWFLAGGLSPDNISMALASCKPDGVDVNSGVEASPGMKNHALMCSLMDKINNN